MASLAEIDRGSHAISLVVCLHADRHDHLARINDAFGLATSADQVISDVAKRIRGALTRRRRARRFSGNKFPGWC